MTAKEWLECIPEEFRKYARQYAIMKCDEQKELCARHYDTLEKDESVTDANGFFRKAPLPEFD